jgi:hypothetical protein
MNNCVFLFWTVTCVKRITNVFGITYELDLDDLSIDQQPERKDQFTLLDYTKCGRIALMKLKCKDLLCKYKCICIYQS